MIKRALNQKTAPHLSYEAFLDLACSLGCIGVEPRNDLGNGLFDGIAPREAGRMARERKLRLLGLSEVYPFNDGTSESLSAVRSLVDAAFESGAETFSLIPRVDGKATDEEVRHTALRRAICGILPMVAGTPLLALVEPIGFTSSSLKDKAELIDAIEAEGAQANFRLVHDTFQHIIAGGGPLYPRETALVHISGISDPTAALDDKLDAHRVLVNADDRCATVGQIAAFLKVGYDGAFSFECTSAHVQKSATLADDIRQSFDLIDTLLERSNAEVLVSR